MDVRLSGGALSTFLLPDSDRHRPPQRNSRTSLRFGAATELFSVRTALFHSAADEPQRFRRRAKPIRQKSSFEKWPICHDRARGQIDESRPRPTWPSSTGLNRAINIRTWLYVTFTRPAHNLHRQCVYAIVFSTRRRKFLSLSLTDQFLCRRPPPKKHRSVVVAATKKPSGEDIGWRRQDDEHKT